jgi:phosphate transport system substrate-binding protein
MHQAFVKNHDGQFVQASVAGATAAAAAASGLSATNFSIVDEPGSKSYPITGYSWALLRTSITDLAKAKALVYLFKWLDTDGQSQGASLQYAPLPESAQTYAIDQLKLIKSGGRTVLS